MGARRAVRNPPNFVGSLLTAVPAVFGRPLTRPQLTYHITSVYVNVFLSIKVTDQSIPSKTRSRSCSFTQRYISRQNTPTKYRPLAGVASHIVMWDNSHKVFSGISRGHLIWLVSSLSHSSVPQTSSWRQQTAACWKVPRDRTAVTRTSRHPRPSCSREGI